MQEGPITANDKKKKNELGMRGNLDNKTSKDHG